MKRCYSPRTKVSGYSLLEVSVSLLLFGLVLLLSANTLVGLMTQSKTFQARNQAYQLAHNLMETLLALPETDAQTMDVTQSPEWTHHQQFEVKTTWKPYTDPKFNILTVEYAQHGKTLIQLSTLKPHHSS